MAPRTIGKNWKKSRETARRKLTIIVAVVTLAQFLLGIATESWANERRGGRVVVRPAPPSRVVVTPPPSHSGRPGTVVVVPPGHARRDGGGGGVVVVTPPGQRRGAYRRGHVVVHRPVGPARGVVVRGSDAYGRPIVVRPAMSDEEAEVQAAEFMANAMAGQGCERMGEALRNLSNQLLSQAQFTQVAVPMSYIPPHDRRSQLRQQARERWRRNLTNPDFWLKVWERLAEAYASCDLNCFEDGAAIGQLSAAAYCAASLGVDGLDAPGFSYQPPLPMCRNSIAVGCQSSYRRTAATFEGCQSFTVGEFEPVFDEYISQDCALPEGDLGL